MQTPKVERIRSYLLLLMLLPWDSKDVYIMIRGLRSSTSRTATHNDPYGVANSVGLGSVGTAETQFPNVYITNKNRGGPVVPIQNLTLWLALMCIPAITYLLHYDQKLKHEIEEEKRINRILKERYGDKP